MDGVRVRDGEKWEKSFFFFNTLDGMRENTHIII